jgi:hypothetical protein
MPVNAGLALGSELRVESDLPIAPSEPLVPRIPSSDLGFQHPARNQSKKKGKKPRKFNVARFDDIVL